MMRVTFVLLSAVAALALPLSARAEGLLHHHCNSCGHGHGGLFGGHDGHGGHGGHGAPEGHGGLGFFQPPFQAAPWYLYWPYDQHFQMPAPIGAPYYAPQAFAHPMQNTYFPPAATPVAPAAVPIPAVK